ncbi:MAG: hypothetical protein M3R48_02315 [Candidatus Dormibacteraeota bacterium]|nr:hypothetical protein [Candidatus Dormibacteraeota bacterium]
MLRQIARLARPVPGAGDRALAIAVYAGADNQPVRAREAGYEGVACVDDAARALELYCDLWEATRLAWTKQWCEGLLDFLLAMQGADGRWTNFILDWDGTPNREGRTSVAGGGFWQARALLALARSSRVLADPRIKPAVLSGMAYVTTCRDVPSDVRSLHVLAALSMLGRSDESALLELIDRWCTEIVDCHHGHTLMNSQAERGQPHLWGHVQEGALAEAGSRLGRDDLVATACRSVDRVFADVIKRGFDMRRVQPYDVASAVYVLATVATVTDRADYLALAATARGWFDGDNPSGQRVYDRRAGRVADGIDGTVLSSNSGAESNIVGAQALFDDATRLARSLSVASALPA